MNQHAWRRRATCGLAIVVLVTGGCSLFPEAMQPINLQKWNRYSGPTSDPFFSVPDHIQRAPTASQDPEAVESEVESH